MDAAVCKRLIRKSSPSCLAAFVSHLFGSLIFTILATILATPLDIHAVEQPDLKEAQTLIAQGDAAQAFAMLAPFEPQFSGDLEFDYLLARAALDSGQPSLASFIYERILAVEPNYVGVRIENGRAYLDLGNYARAARVRNRVAF
jgi:tetratricopeptide (TPR) repeat protein